MNPDQLYREEVFTDQETGSIRRLTPVTRDGSTDPDRNVEYVGQTQVMTPAGPLPLSFELQGNSLGEAASQFAPAAAQAIQEAVEEIKRMQREQQSSIMVPGQGGGSGGMPGGGMPGGGIKL
ncbi:MAG: hypothetical protein EA370_07005 [Wenzhouxiangella sp.]|nr:MAG: hypothetical protein EA370_07005 [Wenzhouxiangella sp.]